MCNEVIWLLLRTVLYLYPFISFPQRRIVLCSIALLPFLLIYRYLHRAMYSTVRLLSSRTGYI